MGKGGSQRLHTFVGPDRPGEPSRVPLSALMLVFFKLGMISFGGGLSGWIIQEVADRRRWMTEDQLLAGLAISQVMPGGNAVNLALFVGQRLRGGPGMLASGFGMLFPPFVFILALAAAYTTIAGLPGTAFVLSGVAAAGVGITLSVAVRGARRIRGAAPVLVAAALFVGVGVLQLPMLPMVAVLAPLGIWLEWRSGG